MKKFYLPFMCLGLLSTAAFSQNTYITGNAVVKVQPNTLFYHGGNFEVTEGVTEPSTIINSGNIRIEGDYINEVPGGTNFVNTYEYEPAEVYGQVIINQDATSSGMLTMEKRAINPATSTWGQFAIPYQFSNAQTAFATLFGPGFVGSGNRYSHSFMTWDNMTRPEFDQIGASAQLNPTDYVILNLAPGSSLVTLMGDGNGILPYAGVPANGAHNPSFNPSMYPDLPWNSWRTRQNYYREQYHTYIEEHLRESNSENFGKYYFQLGNPYTSNINLAGIGQNSDADGVYIQDLLGVLKVTENQWVEGEGVLLEQTDYKRATYNVITDTWAGDPEALIVKPFESFAIVLTADANRDIPRSFPFNDGLKTFSNDPGVVLNPFVTSEKWQDNRESEAVYTEDRVLSPTLSAVSISQNRKSFHQLRLNLYAENDIPTGNKVYVTVDSNTQPGIANVLESEYPEMTKGFFLAQENADGSEVTKPTRKMQINSISPRYVGKPIPLFFEKSKSDNEGHYVKADLFYKNIFNKLETEDINFPDGNSFFFYDKVQDVLLPITTSFVYYIENQDETTSDRYVVYWNGGGQRTAGKMEVSDELADITQVYKDGEVHKIRFNETWDSADISVYDLAGRAIFKKEAVKTDVDFTLNLPKAIVYVVKIQSNTGETVTQKILK